MNNTITRNHTQATTAPTHAPANLKRRAIAIATTLALSSAPALAQATNLIWSCTNGFWDTTSCWSPAATPTTSDSITVNTVSGTDTLLKIDSVTGSANAQNLSISSTGATTTTLQQTGGDLSVSGLTSVGVTGTGNAIQTGGASTFKTLDIGATTGISGHYELSGTASMTTSITTIGNRGTGTFTQSAGSNTVGTVLYIGNYNSGNGTYKLSGTGSLAANKTIIGNFGTGTFTQSGGTLSTNTNMTIGRAGTGTFTQSGGNNTIHDILELGLTSTSAGSYNLSASATLSTTSTVIGRSGTGTFTQSGGNHTASGDLTLGKFSGGSGNYDLSGTGALTAATTVVGDSGAGTFNQSGGTFTTTSLELAHDAASTGDYNLSGGVLNVGQLLHGAGVDNFNWTGGTLHHTTALTIGSGQFFSSLDLNAGMTLMSPALTVAADGVINQNGGDNNVAGAMTNNGVYNLSGGQLTVDGSLDNSGALVLAGGALGGAGELVNNGHLSGFGAIAGSGDFINNALISQGSGHITLSNTGVNNNYGNIDLASGYQFRINGTTLNNGGTVNLNGAIVSGSGTLNNSYGGTLTGRGTISSHFSNNGGVLALTGGTTNITHAFSNSGIIQLQDVTANLVGGNISNSGTLEGHGHVGNAVLNTGTVEAIGGTLVLAGGDNQAGGLITAGAGGKLVVTSGLAGNAGVINLNGGAFDNNGHALHSTGQISGHGVLRTGGLTNDGGITFTGGDTTVNGAVTNGPGGKIEVAQTPALFTGDVVNNGTFKTTNTTVTFAGNYTENGVFFSDPSDNYFTNLLVNETGYLLGGVGDNWYVSGDFINNSLQNTLWNTNHASLYLNGSGTQQLALAGRDLGATGNGYNNNFAWGEFLVASGITLNISDANADGDASLYVGVIDLADGVDFVTNSIAYINSDYNIYYNPLLAGNAYLHGQTFDLNGLGKLIPSSVPLPPSIWLFATGLTGLAIRARHNGKKV